jgi:hypothetical protein
MSDVETATNRSDTGDTPMYCTKCHKIVQHQGPCPKGGNHHLLSISDKGIQGQGDDSGPESDRNSKPTDPHKVSMKRRKKEASVSHPNDRIRSYAMQYLAHDSGDGQTVYHCPFCGGGNVIGRSDGTIECGFCNTHFTVQVQPEFAGMPQTVDGQPYDVPGMPGGVDPMTGQPPDMGDEEMDEDGEMPPEGAPPGAEMGSPEDEEAQGKNGSSVPWEHQSKLAGSERTCAVCGQPITYSDGVWIDRTGRRGGGYSHGHMGETGAAFGGDHYHVPGDPKTAAFSSSAGLLTENQYMAHLALLHSVVVKNG